MAARSAPGVSAKQSSAKVFTGTGRNWNNSYGPITIGPNGTAYVGVFNGLISISDSAE